MVFCPSIIYLFLVRNLSKISLFLFNFPRFSLIVYNLNVGAIRMLKISVNL